MNATTANDGNLLDIQKGLPSLAFRLLVAFGVLAALSVAILLAGKFYGRSLVHAGHTASTERFEILIANDVLSVPANMIRKKDQRRQGLATRLDLYAHWPTLSGFRDDLAAPFNDVDPATNSIVFVSLVARTTTHDMAGRFDPVYKNVLSGVARNAGHGLKSHALSQEHGYVNERLYYSTPDLRTGRRFVARCQDPDASAELMLSPCETDIHVGETLSAQIRFPLRLLTEWQQLNVAIPMYLDGMLIAATR
jgi:hypothetical protein